MADISKRLKYGYLGRFEVEEQRTVTNTFTKIASLGEA
jgi:hypothetical protein